MKIVSIVSLKGGVGRTTLAANLASVSTRNGGAWMALDLDPQNAVGLHFGMPPGAHVGVCRDHVNLSHVNDFRGRTETRTPFLSFGDCIDSHRESLEQKVRMDPNWLSNVLGRVVPEDVEVVLIDTPGAHSPFTTQAIAVADLVLVVLRPDPSSIATIPATERMLADSDRNDGVNFRYVINGTDGRSALSRDSHDAAAAIVGDRLMETSIPLDEAVREALARQRTVVEEAPASQVLPALWELSAAVRKLVFPVHRVVSERERLGEL